MRHQCQHVAFAFGQRRQWAGWYAVDSTHCRAGDFTGCGHTLKQFSSGFAPLGMVNDAMHHTLFVLADAGGDKDGQVAVDPKTRSVFILAGVHTRAYALDTRLR